MNSVGLPAISSFDAQNTAAIESNGAAASPVELNLVVRDSELCGLLSERSDGRERHDFAVDAMKIGAIAVRQAQGRIDADRIRSEGDRIVEHLANALDAHQQTVATQLASTLKEYFDPESGRFQERVERLVREDGELEKLLRRQVGNDGSALARTLAEHVGAESPLMRILDPNASNGVVASLAMAVEHPLNEQRDRILREFSLDNKEGALSRLVSELAEQHGEVGEALKNRIDEVVAEFSLDREDSALSRLVGRVERTQKQISDEFSLDQEGSALARMRRDLLSVIEEQRESSDRFQREVIAKLAEMTARKREADRSTRHGEDFETAVFELLQSRSQEAGDIATRTGNTTGLIRHCRKGDVVIELGPEHAAAGAKVVAEAKEDASYSLEKALAELAESRKNRGAGVGLFVFSAKSACAGLEPFARYGDDVVVVWDAEDPMTDVILSAGLSVAKALCARTRARQTEEVADFDAIERSILEIEKQIDGLDEITRSAETIKSGSDKILTRARIMRGSLGKQVGLLNEKIGDLKALLDDSSAT